MSSLDVSIVVPFRDHEHLVGTACRRIAEYFEGTEQRFEILCVDEGSTDNSPAVLALLRHELPSVRVVLGRGHAAGSSHSRGRVLVLMGLCELAEGVSSSLTAAVSRVECGELDMVLVEENLLVCRRSVCQGLIAESAGHRRPVSPLGLLQRGRSRGLAVQGYGPQIGNAASTSLGRLLAAVVPLAAGLTRA